jgi:hypothetical protein
MARTVYVLAMLLSPAAIGTAHAACDSDMAKLDAAIKTAMITPENRTALLEARKKAVKKGDDAACSDVISKAMARAGLKL